MQGRGWIPTFTPREKDGSMTKFLQYAGIAASVVLIAFGIGAAVIGVNGRDRVHNELAREQIVGTPDSTIPGQKVDTGSEATAFAVTSPTNSRVVISAGTGSTAAVIPTPCTRMSSA